MPAPRPGGPPAPPATSAALGGETADAAIASSTPATSHRAPSSPVPPLAPATRLPALGTVLAAPALRALAAQFGDKAVTTALRQHFDALRPAARAGQLPSAALTPAALAAACAQTVQARFAPRLRPVFNLTGTVLHTNLGRALLPDAAVQAVLQALTAPANLEYDLATGGRGDRDDLVAPLLCELTGAEAATVVNNNAAAVLLVLAALAGQAPRREVIVSRGELVEIGGAFRIPDVMRQAGARLVEVGTTNRTHPRDYAAAITPCTAAQMKVHTSNYAVTGFTASVPEAEAAAIAHAHGLSLVVDLGSGTLVDLARWGLAHEPTVRQVVAAGADVVTFSGDKLLGGPQAGLIVGQRALIERIKRHPLKRALRVGKLTLAALEPVLQLYLAPEHLADRLTTLRLFTRSRGDLHAQATRLQPALQQALAPAFTVQVADTASQIGSGAQPAATLPSAALVATPVEGKRAGRQLQRLEATLRALPRPVIGRIAQQALWLDLRCLEVADEAAFAAQFAALAAALAAAD